LLVGGAAAAALGAAAAKNSWVWSKKFNTLKKLLFFSTSKYAELP
jgi:hypothetical protein